MLIELNIKNFAIIDDLKINFTKGLNVITGETGAGKSILIDAIGVLLGSRTNKDLIQTGKDKAVIEGVFYLEDISNIKPILDEYYIELDDENILIITKEINLNSPSISKVNGRNLNLSMLKNITNRLVDIYGQHEHQSLLDIAKHGEIIDSFGDEKFNELKHKIRLLYEELSIEKSKLKELLMDNSQRDREIDILKFQIEEIEDANLSYDDENNLENEYKRLSNINHIAKSIEESLGYLNTNDFNAVDIITLVNKSLALLGDAKKYDNKLDNIYSKLAEVNFEIQDISRDLSHYYDNISMDEERLDYLSDRIDLVNRLRSKYGKSLDLIFEFKENANNRLNILLNIEKEYNNTEQKIKEIENKLEDYSSKLSNKRKKISKILEQNLKNELLELNMKTIDFKVNMERLDKFSLNGFDRIEFLISTNPGEELKSLSKIVSGGEMSRIMLGFKRILAVQDNIPTLIFDEIDTGISGRTALVVGEKIYEISGVHQVLCISHSPQIAAFGDSHFVINKYIKDNKSKTTIEKLSENNRIEELARLLGGIDLTETTLKHASEMIEMSNKYKNRKKELS